MKYFATIKLQGKGDRRLLALNRDNHEGRAAVGEDLAKHDDPNVITVLVEDLEQLYDFLYTYDLDPSTDSFRWRPEA